MPKISPYTPLVFPDVTEGVDTDGCILVFASSDRIMVQAVDTQGQSVSVLSYPDMATVADFDFSDCGVGDYRYAVIAGLPDGMYAASIADCGKSIPFEITSDVKTLKETLLLQYSEADNRHTNEAAFVIGGAQTFFDLRLRGGFKLKDTELSVSNEQFSTPQADITEISATDYCVRTATIGGADGVVPYIGEIAAIAMACTYLYVNGKRYTLISSGLDNTALYGDRTIYTAKLRANTDSDAAKEIEMQNLILRDTGEDLRKADDTSLRTVQK